MVHSYSHLFGLPTTGLRFLTVYGPWGRPDMGLFLFTRKILAGEPIDVFNNGHHRRDFTYIDDIVEGVIRTLDRVPEADPDYNRSEEHTSELQSLMRISYAVFCLKKKKKTTTLSHHKYKEYSISVTTPHQNKVNTSR